MSSSSGNACWPSTLSRAHVPPHHSPLHHTPLHHKNHKSKQHHRATHHHRTSPRKKIVELKLLLLNNYYENAYVLWNNYSIEKIQFQNSFSGNIFFILRNSCSKSIYVLWNNYSIIEKIPLRYSFLGKKFYYGTIVLKVYWYYGTNILW